MRRILIFLLFAVRLVADEAATVDREIRDIEGWTVHIDRTLLSGPEDATGPRAVRLLESRLADIVLLLPEDKVAALRKVSLWLDRDYKGEGQMCYHPSPQWLRENGFEVQLAKGVHIQNAAEFCSKRHQQVQPWSVLHELAHAYHDQVLGFENERVISAWKAFCDSGDYEKCRHINRRDVRHYGLTDQKEFFAEMTEAYFGRNDFFPFCRADLEDAEPEIHALMQSIWEGKE